MPDMARIETIIAALDINLSRKFNLPKAGPLLVQVPDDVDGGLKTVLTLTKDWDRPLDDKAQGDGVVLKFRIADIKNTRASYFRQSGDVFVSFEPVAGGEVEKIKVRDVEWPKEGGARVYVVYCQRRKQGYHKFFEQK